MKGFPIRVARGRTSVAAVAVLVTTACVAGAGRVDAAEWSLPPEFRDEIAVLEPVQQRFVTSGAALEYLPARQLEHELASRDAESLQGFVTDLMSVAEEMGYDPARDMGAIPLNLTSERFNRPAGPTPKPLREHDREPGPFSVHRYLFPETGVPTFAGAPVAIFADDLIAGDVDVAIIGVPSDMGSGRRNAEHGPRVMRALDTIATRDVQTLLDPLEVLSVVDYGNFSTDNMSTERSLEHITTMVAETAATGAVPMLVGGDTSMLYPGVKGIARHHGDGSFGLVHFSAHPDALRTATHTISDTQAVFLLLDEGIVAGDEMIQVGLRGDEVDVETLGWLRGQGVRYHTMAEIGRSGYDAVLERVVGEVEDGPDALFVSIDVSVVEPSQMVSAGRVVSNGLSVQEVSGAIRHLCAAKTIVGFEITDMAPMLDSSRASAINANAILNACLVGMAARAAGYEADEAHPMALDHGQD